MSKADEIRNRIHQAVNELSDEDLLEMHRTAQDEEVVAVILRGKIDRTAGRYTGG